LYFALLGVFTKRLNARLLGENTKQGEKIRNLPSLFFTAETQRRGGFAQS